MADSQRTGTVELKGRVSAKSDVSGKSLGDKLTVQRSMPESLAAEAAVLGSMIIDPECIVDVIDIVESAGLLPPRAPNDI